MAGSMYSVSKRSLVAMVLAFALAQPALAQTKVAPAPVAPASTAKGPTIFAAASMKTALDAIAAAWTTKTGKAPSISYASSGVLAKQIESGAPAEIFISADLKWMDYLDKATLIEPHTRKSIIGNDLVLIAPADSKSTLKIATSFDLADAIGTGKLAVCTIDSCPAGIYAKQALEKLAVWPSVQPKLAQGDNVRAALLLVSRGETPFGIVYATDAKAEPKVKIIDSFPASTHEPIVYPIALVKGTKNPDAASFEAYMRSVEATKILLAQGFTILK